MKYFMNVEKCDLYLLFMQFIKVLEVKGLISFHAFHTRTNPCNYDCNTSNIF